VVVPPRQPNASHLNHIYRGGPPRLRPRGLHGSNRSPKPKDVYRDEPAFDVAARAAGFEFAVLVGALAACCAGKGASTSAAGLRGADDPPPSSYPRSPGPRKARSSRRAGAGARHRRQARRQDVVSKDFGSWRARKMRRARARRRDLRHLQERRAGAVSRFHRAPFMTDPVSIVVRKGATSPTPNGATSRAARA